MLGGEMKKIAVVSLMVFFTLLLSSCSMHLGLSKLLGRNTPSPAKVKKHIKATHTPPSPSSSAATTPGAMLTPGANTILITNLGYQPNPLQINVGTAITWMNTDSAPHTVTSDIAGLFDSGPINPNAAFTFVFNQAGTFTYHSTSDANVKGTIVVIQ